MNPIWTAAAIDHRTSHSMKNLSVWTGARFFIHSKTFFNARFTDPLPIIIKPTNPYIWVQPTEKLPSLNNNREQIKRKTAII